MSWDILNNKKVFREEFNNDPICKCGSEEGITWEKDYDYFGKAFNIPYCKECGEIIYE